MTITSRLLALAGALLLSACANQEIYPLPLTDISAQQCASTPDLSKAVALTFNPAKESKQSTTFDQATPCWKGAAGNGLYAVFSLPPSDSPYIIEVSSVALGSVLLAPRVTLLASDGTVRREFGGSAIDFRGNGLGVMLRSHPDEAYLVVVSDAGMVGKSDARILDATQVTMMSTGYSTFQMHTGTSTNTTYTFTHNGQVDITLTPIPEKKP